MTNCLFLWELYLVLFTLMITYPLLKHFLHLQLFLPLWCLIIVYFLYQSFSSYNGRGHEYLYSSLCLQHR